MLATHRRLLGLSLLLVAVLLVALPRVVGAETDPGEAAKLEFFEKKVRPLLAENCHGCHAAETKPASGLRVDDRLGLTVGGSRGPAVIPGDPEGSLLIRAVSHAEKAPKMPPEYQLEEGQIAILKQWIQDGAVWPQPALPADLGKSESDYKSLRAEHWAWQPLSDAEPPQVQEESWIRDPLDRFILARLEARGLKPVADADKVALLRRVTFDLTGLPPLPEDVDAFVADETTEALAKVVDRLLASPAFAERWGRHWLDVARYGESTGSARNLPYPHAWRYRDYVIDSFHKDKPFDQFVREQIAGDLLPANSPAEKTEQLVATGFLALGVKDVNQRFKVRFVMDNVDEQIDAVSRSFLALTVSCARCHDHKFDPIPANDYYALAGIFRSTETCDALRNQMGGGGMAYYVPERLILLGNQAGPDEATKKKIAESQEAVKAAQAEFVAIRDRVRQEVPAGPERQKRVQAARQAFLQKQAELVALADPAALGPVALGVRDSREIADTEVRLRGEAEKLGPVVPRGFLTAYEVPGARAVNPRQSGRLELAEWLTHPGNPLPQRVAVNRIWKHLFGEGIVTTVDNFGITGDSPSHPDLLDHLARRFTQEGWSVKKLVRAIVLSRAYQLSSESTEAHRTADPRNRLIWRHAPRRLEAEEIRDAMLLAANQLNLERPAGSPARDYPVRELRNNGPEARSLAEAAAASRHRSVYLPLLRGLVPRSLEAFDFAEQGLVTGSRETTTVAPQALYMLNDPFVRQQSLAVAERIRESAPALVAERIDRAYRHILGRRPTEQEIAEAAGYVAIYASLQQAALADAPAGAGTAADAAAGGEAAAIGAGADAPQPPPVVDPDNIDRTDDLPAEVAIQVADAELAAWASFCQALFATAEFRYLK